MSVSHFHRGLYLVTVGSGTAPEGRGGREEIRTYQLNNNTYHKRE